MADPMNLYGTRGGLLLEAMRGLQYRRGRLSKVTEDDAEVVLQSIDRLFPLVTVERLAEALAVVFAYNASNATIAPDGSQSFEGGPTSYWRDRAEAVNDALRAQP